MIMFALCFFDHSPGQCLGSGSFIEPLLDCRVVPDHERQDRQLDEIWLFGW